jgi:hypothetical protein
MSSVGNIANGLYSGSAELGKIQGLVMLVCGIMIGVVLFICAISYMLTPNYIHVDATVENASCVSREVLENKTNVNVNTCNLTIKYVVNGKEYDNVLITSAVHKKGDVITIAYDPTDPKKISDDLVSNSWISMISIIISVVIVGATSFNYYLLTISKVYSALYGAETAASIIRNV